MNALPPKPADSRWTDDQWSAIVTRGGNVLVSAAAGSGKTAVLIERIVRIVASEQEPVDVDRLLVATFTKAAADEMKHRLRDALEKRLAMQPESVHLRRQHALVHRASITTLHSFCMEIVARHAYQIPLDPGFRIANETESELLRQDVLEEVFESFYQDSEDSSSFWGLVERYSGERSDAALFELVQRIYEFSLSHPFPEQWLQDCVRSFRSFGEDAFHPLIRHLLADTGIVLEGAAGLLRDATALAHMPGGPAVYTETLIEETAKIEEMQRAAQEGSWERMHTLIQQEVFGKLKQAKGEELDKELQERVKKLRDKAKKKVSDLRSQLFSRTPEQYGNEMRQSAPYMEKLVELVSTFGKRYTEAKKSKKLVDFSDLEHYALHVLCEGIADDGSLLPSLAALAYREQFVEVLIDEYQDTNQVQEALLSLISRQNPGNRFMVGDVKQSIYRFRLADPGIFQSKYKSFREPMSIGGTAIDLSRNFRSRIQIVKGVNYIFRQIMDEHAAEISYDKKAELVYGAGYPELPDAAAGSDIDVYLVHRQAKEDELQEEAGEPATDDQREDDGYELETAVLEARLIGMKIREMVGLDGTAAFMATDKETGTMRGAEFKDIVILMRADKAWAPVFIEQLRAAGIPAYAELSTGYFEAIEVDVMLSLLKVIDNPLQDIPFAGLLRSPIAGFTAEQLALIRLRDKSCPFYESAVQFANEPDAGEGDTAAELRQKLRLLIERIADWRNRARNESLSDLIWQIYRETGYFDYVGGLPGGAQRQANLKALYDRSRQFEATSMRGLFRFLRFIKRLQEQGGDLGAAKALGEQDNVVRIMSIHKSKGLEFPIVFVAGMAKMFNQRDLNGDFLLHKELGFGPMIVDPELRIAYPSAGSLAIKGRLRMEMLAEEMRILYVALTRAKEKLILVGTTRNIAQQLQKWSGALAERGRLLPAHLVASAQTFFDWIGPALIRHPALREHREAWRLGASHLSESEGDDSRFKFHIVSQGRMAAWQEAAAARMAIDGERMEQVSSAKPVKIQQHEGLSEQAVARMLEWSYPYEQAQRYYSKTSVTELKRLEELAMLSEEDPVPMLDQSSVAALHRRPKFLEARTMTSAELGTVYHAVMQQLPLESAVTPEIVADTMRNMVEAEIVRAEQIDRVDSARIAGFFTTEIGRRLLRSSRVRKELPFSYGLQVSELHPDAAPEVANEIVIVQGVIDCLFEETDGLVLLDYKTDVVRGTPHQAAERYRKQIELYARAASAITGLPVKEKALYFFDGGHLVLL